MIDNPSRTVRVIVSVGGNFPSPTRRFRSRSLSRARAGALTPPAGPSRRRTEISPGTRNMEARMTGRRRSIDHRDHDGRIAPLAAAGKAERIRAAVRSRYAGAQTGRDRLAAAVDYTRSAAAAAERAGIDDADVMVAEAARVLMAAGDALCAALARSGRVR